jgi:hypothetical protein
MYCFTISTYYSIINRSIRPLFSIKVCDFSILQVSYYNLIWQREAPSVRLELLKIEGIEWFAGGTECQTFRGCRITMVQEAFFIKFFYDII